MNARPVLASVAERAFADVPCTASGHFRLALLGVIAHLAEAYAAGDRAVALEAHPFLADYAAEIDRRVSNPASAASRWRVMLGDWEREGGADLPMLALLRAGLSRVELELLLAVGLAEEDPRFADLFEQATGRGRWPTAGLLLAWWRLDEAGEDRIDAVRRDIQGLVRNGLVQALNPEAPRSEWTLAVAAPLWDALRGEPPVLPWLRHMARAELLPLEQYIAPEAVARSCRQLPKLLSARPAQTLIVRGPRRNGRKTLLGAVAHALGKNLLVADGQALEDGPRWRLLGALAVMLDALPVVELALSPGENRELPGLPLLAGPVGVVAGGHGGIHSGDERSLLTVNLPLPDVDYRRLHWQAAAPGQGADTLDALARSVCLASGNIRRAARAAVAYAQLDGRGAIAAGDVQLACRGLHSARLETLAARVEAKGSLADLAVDEATRAELETLALRCRYREDLAALSHDAGARNHGVRALFAGPSGTGKSLAAKLLAACLGKDLYRIDLSATVNKYLGETEKNLEQAFGAAEELDVVLLLDEGDALMAGRTEVGSSNDRYANLETNFLLQRIESFNGILLVTSNAADRIDKAFARRMDVVIPFRPPDEWQRFEILRLQLGAHEVDDRWLQELACRCILTGGQISNVVSHARLLALQAGRLIGDGHLYAALAREYRKTGAHCPLNRPASTTGGDSLWPSRA